MRPGREHLDQLEAMRRDLQQVIPGEALTVEEVCRHPILTFSHQAKHLFYRTGTAEAVPYDRSSTRTANVTATPREQCGDDQV
jgi:hypothetical protein